MHGLTKVKESVKDLWYNFLQKYLTHFMPLISFDTPWKHQKTGCLLMFSGGIKRSVAWNGLTCFSS